MRLKPVPISNDIIGGVVCFLLIYILLFYFQQKILVLIKVLHFSVGENGGRNAMSSPSPHPQ